MHAEPIERKYALTKIAAGDYLLPSNDGRTLWRIRSYEDGPSLGLMEMSRDRTFWGLHRWTLEIGPGAYVDTEDWTRWENVEDGFERRADAIQEALVTVTGGNR